MCVIEREIERDRFDHSACNDGSALAILFHYPSQIFVKYRLSR